MVTRGTLRARSAAHAAFDPIWKEGHLSRDQAYRRLGAFLGLRSREMHMAQLDEATALRVPEAAAAIMAALDRDPVGKASSEP